MFRFKLFHVLAYTIAAIVALASGIEPSHASASTTWTVIVGGHTSDNSVYANGFYPRKLTIRVGDTVTWKFDGYHNVTFLGGEPMPSFAIKAGDKLYGNPKVFFVAGNSQYDGTGFHSSGTPQGDQPLSYSLTFTKPGRYEYACTIHSGMTGTINVVQGEVAESPAAALARGQTEQAASVNAGMTAYEGLSPVRSGTHVVVTLTGNGQERYSVLRFTRAPLVIGVGTTVTWTMRDPFEIHTVTFTSGEKPPTLIVPEPQPPGVPKLLVNPAAVTPTTLSAYTGTGFVNSGLLFPPRAPGARPSSFSLTFTKPGRYEYWCVVHEDVNMKGVIVVK